MLRLAYIIPVFIAFGVRAEICPVNAPSHFSVSISAPSSLPLIGIRINGGAKFTNQKEIEVEIKSLRTEKALLESMKVGFDPTLQNVQWQPYSESAFKLLLTGDEGDKMIYVQLKDKAGNESPVESNKIIYDTTPPDNLLLKINNDEKYTNDKLGRVLVELKADEAHELMISNSAQFANAKWEPYKESIKWVIDVGAGDGEKSVFAKFKDMAGNESKVISDVIYMDVTPPVGGSITINDGAKYTRSKNVKLSISANDATMIRVVSRGIGKNYDFIPKANGQMDVNWELDTLEGIKSIKVYFMDEAKNTTKVPAEASIIYSATPPDRPALSINQGQKYTNSQNGSVSLQISPKESPQNLKLMLSNHPNFEGATQRAFATAVPSWQLDVDTDGLKTVYARIIDLAGNISDVGKAEIFLDRTAPKVNSFTIDNNARHCIGLKVTLTCDIDDAFEAQYSNNPNTLKNIKWEKYLAQRPDWTILPMMEKKSFMHVSETKPEIRPK
ncbi:MAG: hypothetical protein HC819_03310 [Cyclobacteriaceae bacterium]|nr:hypothetical protein [Cyclobacteriaceae bacterium]